MPKKAVIKTTATKASVEDFLNTIKEDQKRNDAFAILEMMQKATGDKPKMWGSSIIGYKDVVVKSPTTGREVDWFTIGFSPRKANLTIYLMDMKKHEDALKKFGKHKIGGGCLYINKLEDVDMKVLKKMIEDTVKAKKK